MNIKVFLFSYFAVRVQSQGHKEEESDHFCLRDKNIENMFCTGSVFVIMCKINKSEKM